VFHIGPAVSPCAEAVLWAYGQRRANPGLGQAAGGGIDGREIRFRFQCHASTVETILVLDLLRRRARHVPSCTLRHGSKAAHRDRAVGSPSARGARSRVVRSIRERVLGWTPTAEFPQGVGIVGSSAAEHTFASAVQLQDGINLDSGAARQRGNADDCTCGVRLFEVPGHDLIDL
jgi:hypothetical protein